MFTNNNVIREGIAKALFASAWADLQEEYDTGEIGPGTEIMDVMPNEPPESAYAAAGEILAKFQDLNGGFSAGQLHDAVKSKLKDPETFGHYIGMQSLGHGVGLFDYDIDYETPRHEFYLDPEDFVEKSKIREHDEPEMDSFSP